MKKLTICRTYIEFKRNVKAVEGVHVPLDVS